MIPQNPMASIFEFIMSADWPPYPSPSTISNDLPQLESRIESSESVLSSSGQVTTPSTSMVGSSSTGVTLTSFELFPKLPPELRVKVWREALPRARVVFKGYRKVTSAGMVGMFLPYEVPQDEGTSKGRFLGRTLPIPSCLHVCHESRAEGLKKFKQFPSLISRTEYVVSKRGLFLPTLGLYFDPSQDIIFTSYVEFREHSRNIMNMNTKPRAFGETSIRSLEAASTIDFTFTTRLATRASSFCVTIADENFAYGMRTYSNLKELILVEEPWKRGHGSVEGLLPAKIRSDQIKDAESPEDLVEIKTKHMRMRDDVLAEIVKKIKAKMEKDGSEWVLPTVSLVSSEKFWNPDHFHRHPERCFADEL